MMLCGKRLYCFIMVFLWGALATTATNSFAEAVAQPPNAATALEQKQPSAAEKDSASMILAASQPEASAAPKAVAKHEGVLPKWLHMLDRDEFVGDQSSSIPAYGPEVPGDLARAFDSIGEQDSGPGFESDYITLTLAWKL